MTTVYSKMMMGTAIGFAAGLPVVAFWLYLRSITAPVTRTVLPYVMDINDGRLDAHSSEFSSEAAARSTHRMWQEVTRNTGAIVSAMYIPESLDHWPALTRRVYLLSAEFETSPGRNRTARVFRIYVSLDRHDWTKWRIDSVSPLY